VVVVAGVHLKQTLLVEMELVMAVAVAVEPTAHQALAMVVTVHKA
jgi:hypothetical protein